jgi:Mor family transcriptional regulator
VEENLIEPGNIGNHFPRKSFPAADISSLNEEVGMAVTYPEILTDLGEHLAEKLEGRGMEPEQASDLAFAVTEYLRRYWGGQEVYIPKAAHLEQAARDQRIYEAFLAGASFVQLNREFKLTEQRLRQIIRAARLARRIKVIQPPITQDLDTAC